MYTEEKMVTIYIPETLIMDIYHFKGAVLLYLDALEVEGGFALTADEYVTSCKLEREVRRLAGLKE